MRTAAADTMKMQITDVDDLVYNEERTDVVEWLTAHGWDASAETAAEQMERFGRGVAAGADVKAPPTFTYRPNGFDESPPTAQLTL